MSSFSSLGVSAPVCRALEELGMAEPFSIQRLVVPDALLGRDILARSRTGSGKTLAFAIPVVERIQPSAPRPAALVLVPTRELAEQVTAQTAPLGTARSLRTEAAFGGVPLRGQAERAGRAHVLVATPGRLWDLVERRAVELDGVSILVLDEADRMLDMGFQPQVDRIVRRLRPERQTMFFSATLDGTVGYMARAYTRSPVRHEIHDARPVVELAHHRFVPVDTHGKLSRLVEVLSEAGRGLALVFVRTRRGAERLRARLAERGVTALALHGDMAQPARRAALARFVSGEVDVLVATDVAARGIDVAGITHVISYDPPADHKDYVHRVGRTARAGRTGTGVTFVEPGQRQDVGMIARVLELGDEFGAEGLELPRPRRVFSSHRGRSGMRGRRRR